jgi:hypothetical protein
MSGKFLSKHALPHDAKFLQKPITQAKLVEALNG